MLEFNLAIGTKIDDAYIESQVLPVEVEGYSDWTGSEDACKYYSADGDETGTFYQAMQFATKDHFAIWERDHEYEDVHKHIEASIRYCLEESGILNRHKNADPLTCEWGELFAAPVITVKNRKAVKQALRQAAGNVTWNVSESLQRFFQVETVLSWDGSTGKEKFGEEWIADTETRLICMLKSIRSDVLERIHEKGHVLRAFSSYVTEQDADGYDCVGYVADW